MNDYNRLQRIIVKHGSDELKRKFGTYKQAIKKNPKYKDVQRITEEIRRLVQINFERAENKNDFAEVQRLKLKEQKMCEKRNRIIKLIHRDNPNIKSLHNEIIDEVNDIMQKYKIFRQSPNYNAENVRKRATRHIAERAQMIRDFPGVEGELDNFAKCIEQYNNMLNENPNEQTMRVIASLSFWVNMYQDYEIKFTEWQLGKPGDPLTKTMPKKLFERMENDFNYGWDKLPNAKQKLTDIVPFMLQTMETWLAELEAKKKRKKIKEDKENKVREQHNENKQQQ